MAAHDSRPLCPAPLEPSLTTAMVSSRHPRRPQASFAPVLEEVELLRKELDTLRKLQARGPPDQRTDVTIPTVQLVHGPWSSALTSPAARCNWAPIMTQPQKGDLLPDGLSRLLENERGARKMDAAEFDAQRSAERRRAEEAERKADALAVRRRPAVAPRCHPLCSRWSPLCPFSLCADPTCVGSVPAPPAARARRWR